MSLNEGLNPDDICNLCGNTRENHGDSRHQFNNVDDQLIPLQPPPERRQDPPRAKGMDQGQPRSTPEARSLATLVEILAEKQILSSKDIIRIFTSNG